MSELTAPGQSRMNSLDTLRGAAIVMVVAFHVSVHFKPAGWLEKLTLLGNQGVQLFFLVSAITMCLMWEQRRLEPARQSKFYIRRFFRIAPLFWLAMCFYGVSWWANGYRGTFESARWTDVALTASFLHGFSPSAINRIVPGGWSIAVEMSFYLVFPWLAMRLTTPVRTLGFGLVSYLLLGLLTTTLIARLFPIAPGFVYYSMLTQFPIFAVGMFTYQVALRADAWEARQVAAIAFAWLAIAVLGKYAFGLEARPAFWLQVGLFAGLTCLMIRRGLHLPVLSYLGNLSYSMYLFHFAAIDAVLRIFPTGARDGTLAFALSLLLTLVLTTAVAKVSAMTFERWSAAITRKVIARLRDPAEPRLSVV